jgi:hypothetical protein
MRLAFSPDHTRVHRASCRSRNEWEFFVLLRPARVPKENKKRFLKKSAQKLLYIKVSKR